MRKGVVVLQVFFDAEPWALPVTVVACAVALAASPVLARRHGGNPLVWWLYLSAVGGFLAVTITPTGGHFSGGLSTHVIRSMSPSLPNLRDLRALNEVSLNLLVAVPLGAAAVLLSSVLRRYWPLLAIGLPFVSELVQGVLPGLSRVGFVLGDALTNLVGVAMGAAGGVVLALVMRAGASGIEKHRTTARA
ncbi:MAG: hypothetical protein J7518_14350 [Nocardioidaceae bacterium]|nr:hypothetical protein [Nocardioidaceae bacterium]